MAKGTVLVVDDEVFIVDFLTEVLEAAGYRVYAAADDATLRLARAVQPDLILLDIVMPGVGGAELARDLRADPLTAGIPVVALTALPDIHTRVAELAVDDYLTKPFDLDDLLHSIERWSGHRATSVAPLPH